ncbi:MAG TPA: alpha-amylase family glycosyl hydrolase [Chthoniobacterales bacterium]|nr:alpha-amylase family glycosyl hydrolase [Chthoniobacterales bacterium]
MTIFVACLTTITSLAKQTISGSDGVTVVISRSDTDLIIEHQTPGSGADRTVFVAIGSHQDIGSAVLPFTQKMEGSTVFLPFKADRLFAFEISGTNCTAFRRNWQNWKWDERRPVQTGVSAQIDSMRSTFRIPIADLGQAKFLDLAIYAKEFAADSWGRFFGCSDRSVSAGNGDKYIPTYLEINLSERGDNMAAVRSRHGETKLRVYQLFVRLFGNTNETRKQNGTLGENGVGKFNDINDVALKSLNESGFTHIWLTGVLQQATATDYSSVGQPADDPDLLKGLAGSPYAIKDYFDVCPDYASDPKKRIDEFKQLLTRVHSHGMKALIDFVPNHVARSYNSDVKPDLNFGTKGNGGKGDDKSVFFSPKNNFFYLTAGSDGPPLKLPTYKDGNAVSPTCKTIATLGGTPSPGRPGPSVCDGLFEGEKDHGKVTGNNKASWTPDINDWYETVKLNYGFDFTKSDKSVRDYPNANTPNHAVPDTWLKMDAVLAYWQAQGVDGFRCDMSHMVPPEFWNWAIARARSRHRDVVFIGEAYDNDPAKVPGVDPVISKLHGGKSNVMFDLLDAGFNAVYDDPTYRTIKKIYEGPAWANDIDQGQPDAFIFENSLRYAENHDEVRLSAKSQWGAHGMKVGVPVSAILYGLSRGPVMLYNGQEVGEPGADVEGFGGEDSRTSIFDYWSMPEFVKWVNGRKYDGEKLSADQNELRAFYSRLVKLQAEPAFRNGIFLPLNGANGDNPGYGRLPNESASGHWLYSFLRYDPTTGQRFVVVANLNPTTALKDIQIRLPENILSTAGIDTPKRERQMTIKDRLNTAPLVDATLNAGYLKDSGIPITEMPPLSACYLEVKLDRE